MSQYTHILLALDLTDESELVVDKGMALAQTFSSKVSIVHVIEPLNFAYGGDIPMDLSAVQEQIGEQAKQRIQAIGKTHDIPTEQQHVLFGSPDSEIEELAKEKGADLIIVGSHGKHGFALLFGSTANSVLHKSNCDVLAVRIGSCQ